MGNPVADLRFGVTTRSADGRLYARYPRGDRPFGVGEGQNVSAAAAIASATGSAQRAGSGATIVATAASGTATGSPPVSLTALTTLNVTSGAASGTRPWTFGQGFVEGEVPSGAYITTDAAQSQADVRNRWPDGSVKYASISALGAFTQNVKKAFTISVTPTAPSGSNVAELTTLDVVLTITGDGAGTYSLQSCLGVDRSTWSKAGAGRIRQIPGRVMSEFHYYRPTSDPHLAIFWWVRVYSNGSVEVETAVDNAWLDVASVGSKVYAVVLAINGSTVYAKKIGREVLDVSSSTATTVVFDGDTTGDLPNGGQVFVNDDDSIVYTIASTSFNSGTNKTTLTVSGGTLPAVTSLFMWHHRHHRRWYHIDWAAGTDPLCVPEHDVAYYRRSGLMPNFEVPAPTAGAFSGLSTARNPKPFDLGDWNPAMGSGGEQDQIGLVPYQDAHYCASAHPTAYAAVVCNSRCAGRWPVHHRDETTGRPARWEPYGNRSVMENWGVPFTGATRDDWDTPHHPSQGYVPYLVEARWSQLEELQFLGSAMMLSSSTTTRQGLGVLACFNSPLTTRGYAWAVRSVGQAAGISPTRLNDVTAPAADAALQLSYATCIANTATWTRGHYIDPGAPEFNTIGWLGHYSEGDEGPASEFWGRSWMEDFQRLAWGHVSDLKPEGVSQTDIIVVRDHSYKGVISRCGDETGWNYRRLALYNKPYKFLTPTERFMDPSESLSSYKTVKGLPALSANPGDSLKDQSENSDVTPGSSSNGISGYLGQAVAPLAMAAGQGVAGARAAYAIVKGASNFESSRVGVNNKPTFGGIVPRWPNTEFAKAARKLRPGQCIRVPITISQAVTEDGAAPIYKWGDSMCWDGINRELLFVGKRQGIDFGYKFLRIHELTNTADRNTAAWDTGNQNGHGYDHNIIDPATGRFFHFAYGSITSARMFFNGSWTTLGPDVTMEVARGCAWVPGIGIVLMDGKRIRRLGIGASTWALVYQFAGDPGNAYHTTAEYNKNSDLLFYGGGNGANLPGHPVWTHSRAQILASQAPTSRADAPFDIGASETQSNLCADPNGPGWVMVEKSTRVNRYFNPNTNAYTSLAIASGDGSSAADGFPPLATGSGDVGRARINAPIDEYRVQAWLENIGGGSALWFYMPPEQT